LTELEITNFAHNFINLINDKNREISVLKRENARLKATVSQLTEPGRRLTKDEVREGNQPVFCFHIKKDKDGFWGIPLSSYRGVISNRKGIYLYDNYNKTWYAFSRQPEDIETTQ
jgi:hypothetical protein